MDDGYNVALIAATFLLAGTVKGTVGLGLPAISVGLLTALLGLTEAMALATIPAFLTNLWQAIAGRHGISLLTRIWPFLALATITVWLGSLALTNVDPRYLSALLGVLLALYAVVSLAGRRFEISAGHETAVGLVIGSLNGVFTGMTGAFSFPGVLYLQGLGLDKDQLVQAMGMLFALSSLALGLSLARIGFLNLNTAAISMLAMIPVTVGLVAGVRVRHNLSEASFRRLFFWSLLLLGLYIVAKALSS